MKAVVMERTGGPDVLTYKDFEDPKIGNGEVLVRVKACGVNRIDIWIRSGLYKVQLPHILGADVSGVVEAIGKDVEGVYEGEEVILMPAISDGTCEYCLSGWDSLCDNLKLLGFHIHGGYAEYVKVPKSAIFKKPKDLSFEEAAAIPVNFLTAWHMLITRAGIKPGQSVLVVGAGSGIGYAAVQISKLAGCKVIAIVGDGWKVSKAKDIGADLVINRKTDDVEKATKEFTNGKGVDVVFEHAGSAFWDKAIKCLKKGGTMVSCGATTGEEAVVNIRYVYRNQISILGSYIGNRSEFINLLRLFEEKKLRAVIDSVYKLKDAAEAHRKMEENKHFGKLILKIE